MVTQLLSRWSQVNGWNLHVWISNHMGGKNSRLGKHWHIGSDGSQQWKLNQRRFRTNKKHSKDTPQEGVNVCQGVHEGCRAAEKAEGTCWTVRCGEERASREIQGESFKTKEGVSNIKCWEEGKQKKQLQQLVFKELCIWQLPCYQMFTDCITLEQCLVYLLNCQSVVFQAGLHITVYQLTFIVN